METRIIAFILSGYLLSSLTICRKTEAANVRQKNQSSTLASSEKVPPQGKAPKVVNVQNPWINRAWNIKSKMLTAKRCRAVTIGNKIYALSTNSLGNFTVEEYNIESDKWIKRNGISTSKNEGEPAVAALNGKLYVMGGFLNKSTSSAMEEYNPATDKWVRRADMTIPKDCHSAAAANGKVYAIGGSSGTNASLEAEEYNPETDKWTVKAKMITEKIEPGVAVLNNKIYIAAGGKDNVSMEEYDPATDKWTKKANLPELRASFTMETANGKIYAIGGCIYANGNIKSVVRTVNEYDPNNDKWMVKGERPGENWLMSTASYDNKIYVMGGMIGLFPTGEKQDVVQIYDPKLDK